MTTIDPSATARILSFLGYGNPAGLWFVGKEEGLGDMDDEEQRENLIARGRFDPIMDLQAAHLTLQERGQPCDLTKEWMPRTQVWRWAAKISRAVSGAADWQSSEGAKDYIRHSLGRTNGQTFLTELWPIPEKDGNGGRPWRRQFLEGLPDGMFETLLANRRTALKGLIATHKPMAIICYGAKAEQRAVLLDGRPAPDGNSRIEVHDMADGTPVFICPFFGVGQMSNKDAEELVSRIRSRGIMLQSV